MATILPRLSTLADARNVSPSPEELVEGLTILDHLTLFSEPSSPPAFAAPNIPTLYLVLPRKLNTQRVTSRGSESMDSGVEFESLRPLCPNHEILNRLHHLPEPQFSPL